MIYKSSDKDIPEQIKKEVSWWAYAAWTLPLVALGGLFFFELIGWDSIYEKLIVIGAIIFFSVSVFWWWWAIFKIRDIAQLMAASAEKFKQLQEDLSKFKDQFK